MKNFLLLFLIVQVGFFPLHIYLWKNGFYNYCFPAFRLVFNALVFLAMLVFVEKTLVVATALIVFGFVVLDEFMGTDYLIKVCGYFAKKFFNSNKFDSFFTPLIKISTWRLFTLQFSMDFSALVFLLNNIKNPMPEKHADFAVRASLKEYRLYDFLFPDCYGKQIVLFFCVLVVFLF